MRQDRHSTAIGFSAFLILVLFLAPAVPARDGKLLEPISVEKRQDDRTDQKIILSGFNSLPSRRNLLNLERDKAWSLPRKTASASFIDTIKILGLRFDFVEELPDDPLTTGTGKFDFSPFDSFVVKYGHEIDPSPHNRQYFETHFEALASYYFFVSGGKLVMDTAIDGSLCGDTLCDRLFDVYPEEMDSVYHLPYTMAYYGFDRDGLDSFLVHCIREADKDPDVVFSDYDAYFLFHAGSDRQNDVLNDSPNDLFTGYIFYIDISYAPWVDTDGPDSVRILDALIMPETGSQDNRATALNAVMAHEFGHQLGLPDLYRTDNFRTKVGDFALMDNNGFGTGVDFGFEVGRAFGTAPVYPTAWSRAFLGFDSVVVYRQGTSIELVAAEMKKMSPSEVRIAKIPISEYEYYLLENRQIEVDGRQTFVLADSITSVILGPSDQFRNLSGEYDYLLPGSGILIWHVNETVAFMDFDGNGVINFNDNHLQNDNTPPIVPFLRLIEADGLSHFHSSTGAYYTPGYFGEQEDMYYAGNNTSFTPNTNPAAFGYGGANTHAYVTGISESDVTMTFNLERDFASANFPQRAGVPEYGLSPVAADLDGDGGVEIILASGLNLLVINDDGSDFTPPYGPVFYDTAYILNDRGAFPVYPVPLFARINDTLTAGPAIGDFGQTSDTQYVAVAAGPWLHVYGIRDDNLDGQAEPLFPPLSVGWEIVWLSFGDKLTVAVMDTLQPFIQLYNIQADGSWGLASPRIPERELYGISVLENGFALIAGDTTGIILYYVFGPTADSAVSFDLEGYYAFGPVAVDLDRDSLVEIVLATFDGAVKAVTIDTSVSDPGFEVYNSTLLEDSIFSNPVIADLDEDGYADVIIGGKNKIYALDRDFSALINFPIEIDRAFGDDFVVSSPVIADINNDRIKDIVILTSAGNCYALSSRHSLNEELLYGFPLAAGGIGMGSPLIYRKENGGGLGFLGIDGWFYSYDVSYDSARLDWPMGGGNPEGSNYFPSSKLGSIKTLADKLPAEQFFSYPNPAVGGMTNIHYYIGEEADLTLTVYDMSGKKVGDRRLYNRQAGNNPPEEWDLSFLPTGVYRCVLEADFIGGETRSTFTDIAVIK
jgi:M6 family metalloprotease-like protein